MPISNAQQELLESFFSIPDGVCYNSICDFMAYKDDLHLNLATKLLYLARTTEQNSEQFLISLDKIYDNSLPTEEQQQNLDFIRALKLINDLYWNNEIAAGDEHNGLVKALDHYFVRLGEPIIENDYKDSIRELIGKIDLKLISDQQEGEFDNKKQERISKESTIIGNMGWRFRLGLPDPRLGEDFLNAAANNLGLKATYLISLYNSNISLFDKFIKLQLYIYNKFVLLERVTSMLPLQIDNLVRAYPLVKDGGLSTKKAKNLTAAEWEIIDPNFDLHSLLPNVLRERVRALEAYPYVLAGLLTVEEVKQLDQESLRILLPEAENSHESSQSSTKRIKGNETKTLLSSDDILRPTKSSRTLRSVSESESSPKGNLPQGSSSSSRISPETPSLLLLTERVNALKERLRTIKSNQIKMSLHILPAIKGNK